jgi:putative membrane protein
MAGEPPLPRGGLRPEAGLADYLVAGAIWGLANALIRPVFLFLTLPLNLLTLGLFTLVINGAILYLVAQVTASRSKASPAPS